MPDKDPANRQRRYEHHKASGKCTSCLRRPALPGQIRCAACGRAELARKMAQRNDRLKKGLCVKCGERAPTSGRKQCGRCRAQDRARHLANRDAHNASTRAWQQRLKLEVMTHYSGGTPSCQCCGEPDLTFLVIDHVKNDGKSHRKQVGSLYIYSWLKQHGFPAGFQVLCFNCNMGKQFNGGTVCPAADAHALLREQRRQVHQLLYPFQQGFGSNQSSPPGLTGHNSFVVPVPYRAEQGGDEIPLPISPIPISVRHWPEVPTDPRRFTSQRGIAAPEWWHQSGTSLSPNVLAEEIAFFEANRAAWLKQHRGQWMLVKRSKESVLGYRFEAHPTPEAAYQAGLSFFGDGPMLIRQVLETDPVVNIPTVFSTKIELLSVSLVKDPDPPECVVTHVNETFPTLDATGIQPGETRTGKVSFTVKPAKPGASD